ncbi:MAG TPA: hypothetical protein PLE22_10050, partial [Acidovorax sp.]|nr:hypothetical protein [Acidovorax sp.]
RLAAGWCGGTDSWRGSSWVVVMRTYGVFRNCQLTVLKIRVNQDENADGEGLSFFKNDSYLRLMDKR